ncbi:MAG TPA: pseudouridine-5'-phosphate glycosidase [Candidatus Limnocylindria bacterium]|nr:pseudouridine-5'-phosphate glycosidase [Candidatus Limnocylindria bacterium]
MNPYLDVRQEIADALAVGRPVVALESTVISHGLPRPQNLETARKMEATVRDAGAVPASIGLLDGRMIVGLSRAEIELLATAERVAKVSRRDLAAILNSKQPGGTTVAATMTIAAQVGIRIFATGGIGGVHRGAQNSFDISADLPELARTPVAVVCSGAKVILDLPRTLELLETLGIPIVGYGTSEFPAFYAQESGLALDARVDTPLEAAQLIAKHWALGLASGIVICNPPPAASALPRKQVESLIVAALNSAEAAGIHGKAVTPYLLGHLAKASGGKTLETNIALLINNARVAAHIAVAHNSLVHHVA